MTDQSFGVKAMQLNPTCTRKISLLLTLILRPDVGSTLNLCNYIQRSPTHSGVKLYIESSLYIDHHIASYTHAAYIVTLN